MLYFTTDQVAVLDKASKQEDFTEHLRKFNFVSPTLVMTIKNAYSFATQQDMSLQQKQAMMNAILQLIYQIPKLSTIKADFFNAYRDRINRLAQRSGQNLMPMFTSAETLQINHFFQQEVIPFYELFEFVLDENPEFDFVSQIFLPVLHAKQFNIFEGQIVQPETIETLKQFVGERPPKQQKKDSKKK